MYDKAIVPVHMTAKAAKDFLVQQVAAQATLEQMPLSDVEKRMMYFTESDPSSCSDPVGLNDEFEAEYETSQYEAKMSRLLQHAYKRLKAENSEGKRSWDEAISTLKKGDHYLLLLWGQSHSSSSSSDDPGNKVITYGGLFVVGIFLVSGLSQDHNVPTWVFECLGVLLFVLFFLTMFFLAQQGYRALRRRKS
jgi:hypothetical protein